VDVYRTPPRLVNTLDDQIIRVPIQKSPGGARPVHRLSYGIGMSASPEGRRRKMAALKPHSSDDLTFWILVLAARLAPSLVVWRREGACEQRGRGTGVSRRMGRPGSRAGGGTEGRFARNRSQVGTPHLDM